MRPKTRQPTSWPNRAAMIMAAVTHLFLEDAEALADWNAKKAENPRGALQYLSEHMFRMIESGKTAPDLRGKFASAEAFGSAVDVVKHTAPVKAAIAKLVEALAKAAVLAGWDTGERAAQIVAALSALLQTDAEALAEWKAKKTADPQAALQLLAAQMHGMIEAGATTSPDLNELKGKFASVAELGAALTAVKDTAPVVAAVVAMMAALAPLLGGGPGGGAGGPDPMFRRQIRGREFMVTVHEHWSRLKTDWSVTVLDLRSISGTLDAASGAEYEGKLSSRDLPSALAWGAKSVLVSRIADAVGLTGKSRNLKVVFDFTTEEEKREQAQAAQAIQARVRGRKSRRRQGSLPPDSGGGFVRFAVEDEDPMNLGGMEEGARAELSGAAEKIQSRQRGRTARKTEILLRETPEERLARETPEERLAREVTELADLVRQATEAPKPNLHDSFAWYDQQQSGLLCEEDIWRALQAGVSAVAADVAGPSSPLERHTFDVLLAQLAPAMAELHARDEALAEKRQRVSTLHTWKVEGHKRLRELQRGEGYCEYRHLLQACAGTTIERRRWTDVSKAGKALGSKQALVNFLRDNSDEVALCRERRAKYQLSCYRHVPAVQVPTQPHSFYY